MVRTQNTGTFKVSQVPRHSDNIYDILDGFYLHQPNSCGSRDLKSGNRSISQRCGITISRPVGSLQMSSSERTTRRAPTVQDGSYHPRSFMRKVSYGTDYELLHFVYDLSIWTTVGTKKNVVSTMCPYAWCCELAPGALMK